MIVFKETLVSLEFKNVINLHYGKCHNLSLGLVTKAKDCKVASQEGSFGVKESVREWTPTLPREFPLWELESRWSPECLDSDFRGQNPMDWGFFYTVGKLLERRCLKWARMTHLDIWNTSYGQKKGQESNWQFDSRPLKSKNRLDFLACKRRATYRWKALNKGYNFASDLISIGGLHVKLWGPKVGTPTTLGPHNLRESQLWGQKCHLDVGFVERHKVYYKGEGGGFPQVRAVVNLVSSSLLVARSSTKSATTMH